jgi:DNA replication protein DnaC
MIATVAAQPLRQIPVENWHSALGDPTLADAILDRLVHNTYRINMNGESMRKRKISLTENQQSE